MPKDIAVITVHGMGDTDKYYYRDLERKLRRYVGKSTWDERVHLGSVYYQDLMQKHQQDYWDEADDKYSLRWDFLRKFMLFSFSDAASIEHSMHSVDQTLYRSVHAKIASAFDDALEALGGHPKPVLVVAHSLGCEQVSNYLWDAGRGLRFFAQDAGTETQKRFRRMASCRKLVTTGCNIPIFRAGLAERKLFDRPNDGFEWDNYFDAHDVLGYPMRDLSPDFDVNWIDDNKVGVGGLVTGWNPASHGGYWTDPDVLRPIASDIKSILGV